MKKPILLFIHFILLANVYPQTSQQLADSAYSKMSYGKFTEAVSLLLTAINADTSNSKAFYYMGLAKANSKNYNQAIVYFSKAIELDTTLNDALYNRAVTNYYLGKNKDALDDYTKLINKDRYYYLAYIGAGNIYADEKDFKIAVYYYSTAMKIEPKNPDPYRFRGSVYYNSGKTDDACYDWDKAISLGDTISARYRLKYCVPYFTNLIDKFTNEILEDPNDTAAYAERYYSYAYLKKYTDALLDLNKIIELNPADTVAYYNRGVIYGYLGSYDNAIIDYSKALDLYPSYLEALYNRSEAFNALKNYKNAIDDLTSLILKSKGKYNLYQKRGTLYLLNGDNTKACEDFKTAFDNGDMGANELITKHCK